MRHSPQETIKKLINERYSQAGAVFWAGSVSQGEGTDDSDLDLVIIYEQIQNAYREAIVYEDWLIDVFVHDLDTLRYFFTEIDGKSGVPALPVMVAKGILVTPPSDFSEKIRALANEVLENGPPALSHEEINRARFYITDVFDDIKSSQNRMEQIASISELYGRLADFYFRAQGKWSASGKAIVRWLKLDNPEIEQEFTSCFNQAFQFSDIAGLQKLTEKILKPYGGFLWEGYYSDAPQDAKIPEFITLKQKYQHIYELEISLLKPQTRKSTAQLKLLIADEFIEYGASGLIYNKNDLLDSLPKEESQSYLVKHFSVLEVSPEVMLATYKVTVASKSSLRSSLWQYKHNRWQMVFHQGTPCQEE